MLRRSPNERPTAEQALQHPWLQGATADESAQLVREQDLGILLDFACQNDLRRATLGVLAATVATSEVTNEAENLFNDMDLNRSGTIQLSDFEQLMARFGVKAERAKTIFSKLDLKANHEIHFSEFLAAYQQMALLRDEASLKRAFDAFDTDNSGFVSAENLHEIFGAEFSGNKTENMLLQAGCQDKQGLSYEQFFNAVNDSRTFFQLNFDSETSPGGERRLSGGGSSAPGRSPDIQFKAPLSPGPERKSVVKKKRPGARRNLKGDSSKVGLDGPGVSTTGRKYDLDIGANRAPPPAPVVESYRL